MGPNNPKPGFNPVRHPRVSTSGSCIAPVKCDIGFGLSEKIPLGIIKPGLRNQLAHLVGFDHFSDHFDIDLVA